MSLTNRFDKLNDPKDAANTDQKTLDGEEDIVLYDTPGQARNICFVEANGKQTFLNYAYLVSGEYNPETSEITLAFTTHIVRLKGSWLDALFEEIMIQKLKIAICLNDRYSKTKDDTGPRIKSIIISKN